MRATLLASLLALAACDLATGVNNFRVADGGAGSGGEGAGNAEPACGDGVRNAGEECDDGNLEADDGCSAGCLLECEGLVQDPVNLHCYAYDPVPRSWREAHESCLARGGGWDLVAINSEQERDRLDDVLSPPNGFWTGGRDVADTGEYSWSNGDVWGYEPWLAGEPDSDGSCVGTWDPEGESNMLLYDRPCSDLDESVCELRPAGS